MPLEEARRSMQAGSWECAFRVSHPSFSDNRWECKDNSGSIFVDLGTAQKVVTKVAFTFFAEGQPSDIAAQVGAQYGLRLTDKRERMPGYSAVLLDDLQLTLDGSGGYWHLILSSKSLTASEDKARIERLRRENPVPKF